MNEFIELKKKTKSPNSVIFICIFWFYTCLYVSMFFLCVFFMSPFDVSYLQWFVYKGSIKFIINYYYYNEFIALKLPKYLMISN